jgi:hypothetical protein
MRPRGANDPLDQTLFNAIVAKLAQLESEAKNASHLSALNDLNDDADLWGMFRGYLCPEEEITREGQLALTLLKEWGVPKESVEELRKTLGRDLEMTPAEARSALYLIFKEQNAWCEYTSDYESIMERYAKWLFSCTVVLILLALPCYSWATRFPTLLVAGVLCAGAGGSCVSVMARMPAFDIRFSNELEAYLRSIIFRVGVGIAATTIGCAMLAWGVIPIAFGGLTFAAEIQAKTDATCAPLSQAAQSITLLVLVGVPMLHWV